MLPVMHGYVCRRVKDVDVGVKLTVAIQTYSGACE